MLDVGCRLINKNLIMRTSNIQHLIPNTQHYTANITATIITTLNEIVMIDLRRRRVPFLYINNDENARKNSNPP